MRTTHWVISLFFAVSLATSPAMAAEEAPASAPTKQAPKMDTVDGNPASLHRDGCPMHHDNKKCDHKKGEPCPYHRDGNHHAKSHDKCDHKHPD
jgi:hypothetical protein